MVGLIASLAKMGIGASDQLRAQAYDPASFDQYTGQVKNQGRFRRQYAMQHVLNPAQVLRDKDFNFFEKALSMGSPIIGGILLGKKKQRLMEERAAETAKEYEGIRSRVEEAPEYEIAPETQQQLELLQQTGQDIEGLAGEVTDIASKRASREESPGAQLLRKEIRQNSAGNLQAIQESGSPAAMQMMLASGAGEKAAFGELSNKNIAYRFQAESDLMNAKINEAQTLGQSAQLESMGLQGMIDQRAKQFQSKQDKALSLINFDIMRESQGMQNQIQLDNMRARTNQALTNGLINIGTSFLENRAENK